MVVICCEAREAYPGLLLTDGYAYNVARTVDYEEGCSGLRRNSVLTEKDQLRALPAKSTVATQQLVYEAVRIRDA